MASIFLLDLHDGIQLSIRLATTLVNELGNVTRTKDTESSRHSRLEIIDHFRTGFELQKGNVSDSGHLLVSGSLE